MDLIIWLVIGGVIGWLASIVMKTNAQMGMIANVIVGIVGAALGGWLAGVLGIGQGGVMSYAIALGGAIILILILRALGVFK
ncbi:MAG: GlsB/YeaQ/YmgE family stress response membrane protein [Chromatiales bacterium]|nr:GlsB/YeaQ/YmgE family stress response membrane protein [Chromatiales bacterium]